MTEKEKFMQYILEAVARGDLTTENLKELIDYARRLLEASNAEGSGNE